MRGLERRGGHAGLAGAALLAVSVCGCAASKTQHLAPAQIRAAKEASEAELLDSYNRVAGGVKSVNASVELVPTAGSAYSGVIQQYHEVNAFILAQKPAMIRVIGQAPVIAKDIFDMASDGQTFHIFIPSKNQFIVGPATFERAAAKPIENLRPQHLLDALFWPEIRDRSSVLFEEDDEQDGRYYVLTLIHRAAEPSIERKIWFDRADLGFCRFEIYGDGGLLLSDIRLAEWQGEGAQSYPHHIWLDRPHDDYKLEIRVNKLTLNEPIDADKFRLEQPPGSQLVRIEEAGGK
jgi:outer membrane lipoprotein-sorting protein